MTPLEFSEQTTVFAKDQHEYLSLPAHVSWDGVVTSCWQLEPLEIELLQANGGKLWISQMTVGHPLQPVLPSVFKPKLRDHEQSTP